MRRWHFAGVVGACLVLAVPTGNLTTYAHEHHLQALHAAMVVGVVLVVVGLILGVLGVVAPRSTTALVRSLRPRKPGPDTGWWILEVTTCLVAGGLVGGLALLGTGPFWIGFVVGAIFLGATFLVQDVLKGRREGKRPWDV
jgi:hypothetical protein